MADLFRKYKSLFSTTSNSFSTGSDVEITLNSVTGLPTDTDITLTFDRVDQNGIATSGNKMERIIGTVSGSTFTIKERGADGTTEQAHTSPVVEMIWNARDLNDMVDGILVEHNTNGTHDTTKVVDLTTAQTLTNKTLTSPVINNATFTGGGALLSKMFIITRDGTAASGTIAYTGVGFQPTSLIVNYGVLDTLYNGRGASDSARNDETIYQYADNKYAFTSSIITYSNKTTWAQSAVVTSYDADGFTLTWTKASSPSAGIITANFICYR